MQPTGRGGNRRVMNGSKKRLNDGGGWAVYVYTLVFGVITDPLLPILLPVISVFDEQGSTRPGVACLQP